MTNLDRWHANFEVLKEYVTLTGHFPNKHNNLNNWCCYQRKLVKAVTMLPEQQLFEQFAASRSDEHTGGRKKRN